MDNKNILVYCIIKDEQWYSDEVSDTTLMTIAASLLGQQKISIIRQHHFYHHFFHEHSARSTVIPHSFTFKIVMVHEQ
jgi:hypothetical protein